MARWTLIGALVVSFCFHASAQEGKRHGGTGMLVLGSANLSTLKTRVEVAYKLYASGIAFDYIIVSGGCAAHGSNICEASEMENILREKGVPPHMIFKEEKSMSTAQNYCYSRVLKDGDGMNVINPKDKLYVVSDHWHAMSVAARFTLYDSVQGLYHIEGAIRPRPEDKVDYTNIFNNAFGADYCKSVLWPSAQAAYSIGPRGKSEKVMTFYHDYVVRTDHEGKDTVFTTSAWFPGIPSEWKANIEAAFYNEAEDKVYLFKGPQFARLTHSGDFEGPRMIRDWVSSWPEHWRSGTVDAALFDPVRKKVVLFKKDEYIEFSPKKPRVDDNFPMKTRSLVSNWPFGWGSGEIDAAYYDRRSNEWVLYRGKEYLRISSGPVKKIVEGYPGKVQVRAALPR